VNGRAEFHRPAVYRLPILAILREHYSIFALPPSMGLISLRCKISH